MDGDVIDAAGMDIDRVAEQVFMRRRRALARLMREVPAANSVHVSIDKNLLDAFYARIKAMPIVSGSSTSLTANPVSTPALRRIRPRKRRA